MGGDEVNWIFVNDAMPPEGEYVFVRIDDWIGISRFIDEEWDRGLALKLPVFKKNERSRSGANPNYWAFMEVTK